MTTPLTPEQLAQLATAQQTLRPIRRAVAIARFDGWCIAAFALLTLLCGLTGIGAPLGLLMGTIAFVELRAAGKLARLDGRAPRILGYNQIALASLLILYALWRIYTELTGPGAYAEIIAADPELAQTLQPVEQLTRSIALLVYAAIILVAVLAQGGLALYYFTRAKVLQAHLSQTPAWVLQWHQSLGIT